MFCPNTGTKFREPYHLNHVIPRLVTADMFMQVADLLKSNQHKSALDNFKLKIPDKIIYICKIWKKILSKICEFKH